MKIREHSSTQRVGWPWPRKWMRHLANSMTRGAQLMTVCLLVFSISGCFEEDKVGISYVGVNHTDDPIASIIVNGEGGVLNVTAQNTGSEMCCVIIPSKWQPGLKATIKWQGGGTYKRDAQGNIATVDSVPVVVESPWKSKTVNVPAYDEQQLEGRVYIHFFPRDDVKVTVNKFGPGHISHPYPSPRKASEH
jgi:hypothetical protein